MQVHSKISDPNHTFAQPGPVHSVHPVMTTRHLYLTRHGEATESLTPTGREQALLLGKRLRQYPISTVVHGPSERTSQTAALIAPHLGVKQLNIHFTEIKHTVVCIVF